MRFIVVNTLNRDKQNVHHRTRLFADVAVKATVYNLAPKAM